MTITQTIVHRAADACPTTWCSLPGGHESGWHRTTVAGMDTPRGTIQVELESTAEGEAPLINFRVHPEALDDLTVDEAHNLAVFLTEGVKVASLNLDAIAGATR